MSSSQASASSSDSAISPAVDTPDADIFDLVELVADEPGSAEPVAEGPTLTKPIAEEPVPAKPVVDEPVVDEPVTDTPDIDKPDTPDEGEAKEPSAPAEPLAEDPISEASEVEAEAPEAEAPAPEDDDAPAEEPEPEAAEEPEVDLSDEESAEAALPDTALPVVRGVPEPALYQPLTLRAAWQLMAPPSWIASIAPVLVGGLMALMMTTSSMVKAIRVAGVNLGAFYRPPLSWHTVLVWVLMLICAVAAQAAGNVLNDYKDFVVGTDTEENCVDTTDASIIYNHLRPATARNFGIACLLTALLAGVAVSLLSTPWLLLVGGVGIVALLSYSYGPKPTSYLPLGEVISGLTFGLLIAAGAFVAITRTWSWWLLIACAQQVLSIGLIMMTNNTCDIERDKEAGRKTLPVLLGRKRALIWIAVGNVLALLSLAVLAFLLGWFPLLLVAAACWPVGRLLRRLGSLRFNALNRPAAMQASTELAIILAITNCAVLLVSVFWQAVR